jgi:hypothetical protein
VVERSVVVAVRDSVTVAEIPHDGRLKTSSGDGHKDLVLVNDYGGITVLPAHL